MEQRAVLSQRSRGLASLRILKTMTWDKCFLEKHSVAPEKDCGSLRTVNFHSFGGWVFSSVTKAFFLTHQSC